MFSYLFSQPLVFIVWVAAFLVALSVHEFSHALAGTLLGDATAKRLGRLTLNPAAHVDMFGLLAVLFIGFGWGKPVPYNPYNLKNQRWGPVLIALAGPVSNFIFGAICLFLLSTLGVRLGASNLFTLFLFIAAQLNVALMAFNLIPLPPLDGSKVLLALLDKPQHAAFRNFILQQGPYLLLMFVILDSVMGLGLFSGLINFAFGVVSNFVSIPGII
jgi:Zn-dependent protease